MSNDTPILTPRLVVDGAAGAIDHYEQVFGARCLERYATADGRIVHAALSIRGAVISIVDADGAHNLGPTAVGGSPVMLHLTVDDPDAVADALVNAGGRIVIPIDDRYYGYREGRVADRFGHLWILSRQIERLDPAEIERRVRAS